MTLRCDGNTTDHVAFGGPIFYGHDPHGEFNEGANHDDNVFWEQALAANRVYEMLDGRQRKLAEVPQRRENRTLVFEVPTAISWECLSPNCLAIKMRPCNVLQKLIEPYRQCDRDEVLACLKSQGGFEACHLAFFTDHDIGDDRVWDNWRLEGPSFVWHFRGSPHVHVWVNVADADVPLNA